MTLRFTEGFDWCNADDLRGKWDFDSDNAWATNRTPRFGNGNSASRNGYAPLNKTFDDSQQTWVVGAALQATSTTATNGTWFTWADSGTSQCTVGFIDGASDTKDLVVYRGAFGGTLLGTAEAVLTDFQWHYIEAKITIDNSTGAVEIRKDGATVLNLTSQDTQVSANASANKLIYADAIVNTYHDDVYVLDTNGSSNNDFLGDVRIQTLYPNGNGNSSQFTGSDGNSTDNYLLVDDNAAPDDDTTYVETTGVNNIDLYTIEDLTNSPTNIYGVSTQFFARKTDVGSRGITAKIRSNGTNYSGSGEFTLNSSYGSFAEIFETDPDTGVAWITSGVNNMESGFEATT